jgi:hypothetical protein
MEWNSPDGSVVLLDPMRDAAGTERGAAFGSGRTAH